MFKIKYKIKKKTDIINNAPQIGQKRKENCCG